MTKIHINMMMQRNMTEVISKNLNFVDGTAAAMCRDNEIPLLVFNLSDPKNIVKVGIGEHIGTLIS